MQPKLPKGVNPGNPPRGGSSVQRPVSRQAWDVELLQAIEQMRKESYDRGWQEGRADLLKSMGLEPDGKLHLFSRKDDTCCPFPNVQLFDNDVVTNSRVCINCGRIHKEGDNSGDSYNRTDDRANIPVSDQ